MTLVIVAVMWFFFANAIQSTQESVNEQLSSDHFASTANWNSFNLANTFMNNLWIFFVVFVVLGCAYYGYNVAQRRSQ